MSETESPLQGRGAWHALYLNALWTGGEHVLGLLAVFLCVLQLWPVKAALQWLLQTSVVLSFVHLQLHRHLGENHSSADGELAPSLGVANRITLGRGWGISCLAGLIFLPGAMISSGPIWVAYIPGLLYLAVGCADFLDGLWARRTGTESVLGRRFDVEMDALGLLAASALAVWLGRLPLFYLMVGASYYLFRFGTWYRVQRSRVVLPLKDRPTARIMAGLNMGFVCAALLPVFAPQVLKLAAIFFSVPLLVGFLWDWLLVSARLTEGREDRLQQFIAPANGVLALVMRIVVLVSGPAIAGTLVQSLPPMAAFAGSSLWVMIVLGWMGRTASLVAACWLTLIASSGDVPPLVLVTLSAVLVLTILGTGHWSWWKPEDACLSSKVGARSTPQGRLTVSSTMTDLDYQPSACSLWRSFNRSRAGYLALLLIPVFYWFAFKDIAGPALFSAMAHWGITSLGLLGVLNLLIVQAMCLRWGLILKRSGHRVPFSRIVFYRLSANAVSYLTPGPQFGGEPLQVHWLSRSHGIPPDAAAASVAVDRLLELIANLCFLLLMGIVLLHGHYFDRLSEILILALMGLLGMAAIALCRVMATGRTPLTRMARFGTERFGLQGRAFSAVQFLERVEKQAASALNVPPRVLWLYGACAGIQWVLMLSEFWFIYYVLGVSLSPLQLFVLMGAARLTFLLPLPGALGALEAGQLVVLTTLILDPVSGLAACLTMRARDLILIGTGALESIRQLLHTRPRPPLNPLHNDSNGA